MLSFIRVALVMVSLYSNRTMGWPSHYFLEQETDNVYLTEEAVLKVELISNTASRPTMVSSVHFEKLEVSSSFP